MSKFLLPASLLLGWALAGCNPGETNKGTTGSTGSTGNTGEEPGTTDSGTGTTDSGTGTTDSGTGTTDSGTGTTDSGTGGDTGSGGGAANAITGSYGANAILPVQAAYWIGQPGDPTESGGGPFLYLFSAPVTCDDISKASWLDSIPAGTQVLEMIVGTTSQGATVPVARGAGADKVEVNYTVAGGGSETRATGGNVTLTNYTPDGAVDGRLDVTFPDGTATGTFHATWCPTGQEF